MSEDFLLENSTASAVETTTELLEDDFFQKTTTGPPPLPDYVCCAVTEGVWTWFSAILLIVVLFTFATMRYCKKSLQKPKFLQKGQDFHLRCVLEDDRRAIALIKDEPVPIMEFEDYYKNRQKHKTIHKLEFRKGVDGAARLPITMAKEDENKQYNSNHFAVPFDHNRVTLQRDPDDATSDYINASYVKGHGGREKSWIVTQGPTEKTAADFWLMVWQEQSPAIIMLTKTYEFIKVMCVHYWPLHVNKPETHGDFVVTLLNEENYAHFKVRTLRLQKNNDGDMTLTHYQYDKWPVHTPPTPNLLLQFRRRLVEDLDLMKKDGNNGLPIVHCNDGGLRSGSFLLVMENLRMAKDKGEVNVMGEVKRMLEERRSLVTHPDQIKYAYDVIQDHLICGETSIDIEEILPRLQAKSKKSQADHMNEYTREHKLLETLVPRFSIGDCAAGHRAENHTKNRNVLVVPPDNNRPYLTSFQSNDSTDYINAVFVDGYRKADEFICTEWPMANTIANFWSMVYDHDIKTIVVLNHHKGTGGNFPSFWPSSGVKQKNYGPVFCVEQLNSSHFETKFASWDLRLMKQEVAPHKLSSKTEPQDLTSITSLLKSMQAPPKEVQLFQILCWPGNQKVPNSTNALVHLVDEVERWRGNDCDRTPEDRVVVVSNDGYSRCGIYCAAAACLEQVRHRREVDVFQAVKTARKSRPQLVASAMEYKYCYDVMLHYVLNYCREQQE